MRAKIFFQQARSAERDLRRLEAVREHYMELGSKITSHWGCTPTNSSSNGSKVETAVLGIVEAEQGVREEYERYMRIVLEAERVISAVPQSRFRQILTLHYIVGLSLADTGEKLGYKDRNSIYRAHGWSLVEAQKILDRKEGKNA